MEEINTICKVTVQMVDTTSPFLNTSIVEIEDVPLNEVEHRNLINFLLEAKQPRVDVEESNVEAGDEEKPDIILPGDK